MTGLMQGGLLQGGILGSLGSGTGVLSVVTGPIKSRLAAAQAATSGGIMSKIQAAMAASPIGARLTALKGTAATPPASTQLYQSTARVYASPTPPPGVSFR